MAGSRPAAGVTVTDSRNPDQPQSLLRLVRGHDLRGGMILCSTQTSSAGIRVREHELYESRVGLVHFPVRPSGQLVWIRID